MGIPIKSIRPHVAVERRPPPLSQNHLQKRVVKRQDSTTLWLYEAQMWRVVVVHLRPTRRALRLVRCHSHTTTEARQAKCRKTQLGASPPRTYSIITATLQTPVMLAPKSSFSRWPCPWSTTRPSSSTRLTPYEPIRWISQTKWSAMSMITPKLNPSPNPPQTKNQQTTMPKRNKPRVRYLDKNSHIWIVKIEVSLGSKAYWETHWPKIEMRALRS